MDTSNNQLTSHFESSETTDLTNFTNNHIKTSQTVKKTLKNKFKYLKDLKSKLFSQRKQLPIWSGIVVNEKKNNFYI